MILGGAIVGLGVWLYSRRNSPTATLQPQAPTPPPPTGFAYGGTGAPASSYQFEQQATATHPVAPPKSSKQRSYLGLITLLGMIMVAGLLGAAQIFSFIQLSIVVFLSVLLAVVSAGLVVGAFMGRARWLIAPALALALAIGVAAPVSPYVSKAVDAGIGERTWQPMSAGLNYELGLGAATLDLTKWAANPLVSAPKRPDPIDAHVVTGQLIVLVPATWQATVEAEVQLGELILNGLPVSENDAGVEYEAVLPALGKATGQIALNLSVDVGQVEIRQVTVPSSLRQPELPNESRADANPESDPPSGGGAPADSQKDNDKAKQNNTKKTTDKEKQQ